jgi:type II secretory pathway component PulJ
MRKGFMLVEVLAAVALLASVSVALAALFVTIVDDIPRSYRLVQEYTSLLNMLERMREDVTVAKSLPQSFGQYSADENLLLIELADGVISYQVRDGKILRGEVRAGQDKQAEHMQAWPVPHAKVNWQVWRQNSNGYVVEIKTHIEHKVRGPVEKKMANSHLYFVGAPGEVLK